MHNSENIVLPSLNKRSHHISVLVLNKIGCTQYIMDSTRIKWKKNSFYLIRYCKIEFEYKYIIILNFLL